MFITENSIGWPTGTVIADGSIANSLSMISIVAGPAAACSSVPPLPLPPLHDAASSARTLAMLSSPHLRTDLTIVRSSSISWCGYLPSVSAASPCTAGADGPGRLRDG